MERQGGMAIWNRKILRLMIVQHLELPGSCVESESHLPLWLSDESCHLIVVAQSLSRVRLFVTPWTAGCQASLSFTVSQSLLRLTSIESVMPSNLLILSCPLLLPPSISPTIRVFSSESVLCIRWPQNWILIKPGLFWIFNQGNYIKLSSTVDIIW